MIVLYSTVYLSLIGAWYYGWASIKLAPLIEDKLKTYCLRKETVDVFQGMDLSTLDYKELSLAFVERYKGKMLSENQLNERRTFYNRLNSCDSTLFTFLKEKF